MVNLIAPQKMRKNFLVIEIYTELENTLSEMPDEIQKMNVVCSSWETFWIIKVETQ